jgi:hypothetical protein
MMIGSTIGLRPVLFSTYFMIALFVCALISV